MPRQARKKSQSGIYHIMLRGINRQQIFEDDEDCEKFLEIMKFCKTISNFQLYAYCLMGNHVHLLIKETDESIDQIIKRITARFVYWYNIKYQRIGHLFQDRFKSEPVEDDSYFATVVRYIHQNPTNAGLCGDISDYKYSSYNHFFEDSEFIDRDFVFGIIPFEMFSQFNKEISAEKCLEIEDYLPKRVTDEQAKKVIYKYSKCKSVAEFQKLNNICKQRYVKKFHKNGVSIRQIARLCGETKGIVEKWLV